MSRAPRSCSFPRSRPSSLARVPRMRHAGRMPKRIQVRSVPDRLRRELVRRARKRGRTVTSYIREILEREVSRPLAEEVFEQIASYPGRPRTAGRGFHSRRARVAGALLRRIVTDASPRAPRSRTWADRAEFLAAPTLVNACWRWNEALRPDVLLAGTSSRAWLRRSPEPGTPFAGAAAVGAGVYQPRRAEGSTLHGLVLKGRGFCPSCGGWRRPPTSDHILERLGESRARPL